MKTIIKLVILVCFFIGVMYLVTSTEMLNGSFLMLGVPVAYALVLAVVLTLFVAKKIKG